MVEGACGKSSGEDASPQEESQSLQKKGRKAASVVDHPLLSLTAFETGGG